MITIYMFKHIAGNKEIHLSFAHEIISSERRQTLKDLSSDMFTKVILS